jgi:ABC-type cobalamin/Fe3+-siderophores transport system ATPase subunit
VAQGATEAVLTPATLATTFGVSAEVGRNDFLGALQVAYRLSREECAHG